MSALDSLAISSASSAVASAASSSAAPAAPAAASKPFLILCGKPMTAADQAIFAEFGTIASWSQKYVNMPLNQITPFDYLLCDMNSKSMRLTLGRTDLSQYQVVHYVSQLQKMEDFVEQVKGNILTSIPSHAVNKADFDSMLVNEKLMSPSTVKTILKWVKTCLGK